MIGVGYVREWDVIANGFTRETGRLNGCTKWWRSINSLSSDTRVVEYRTWHGDWRDLADQITLFADPDKSPVVRGYGYSYGGYSCVLLARLLRERGIPVRSLVLVDAVYRHWYALGAWRSIVPNSTIEIPDNVDEVHWFRQRHPRFAMYRVRSSGWGEWALPAGHDAVPEDGNMHTVIHDPVVLNVEHSFIDDHPAVRGKVFEVAESTL